MLLPRSLVVWCAWLVGMGSLLTLQGQAPSNASAGGPPGGYLVAIAVSRDAAATLYASPLSGGVFRSADGGASWVEAGNGLPPGDSCDLQVHPADGRIVFAECRDGLYRTRDSGQGWARIAEDAQLPAIAPSSSEILVATLNRSKDLLVSRTGGRRWERHTPTGLGDRSIRQVVICRSNPAVIYGVTHFGRGLFRSVDSGRHWTAVRLGLDSEAEVNHVRNDPRAVDAIYVAAGPYLLRGDCRGASWAVLHEFSEHIAAVMFSGPPRALAIVVGSRGELFRSEDDGARWRGLGWTPEGHAWNMAGSNMTGNAVSSTLYAATFRGLMTTADDGAHWNRVTGDNLGRASVRSVSIDRNALRVSADVGDFISIDRGATWRAVETPAGEPETWAAPSDPAVQYRSGKDGFLKSMDGGQHWTSAARPADRIPLSLAVSPNDPALLYASVGDVLKPPNLWRSRDGALTWTRVDQCSELPAFACTAIFDPNDANTVYGKTRGESPNAGWESLRRSVDGGDTWQELKPPAAAVVWLLTVLPTRPTTLFVDVPGGADDARHTLWRSTDRGDHWERSDAGLPSGHSVTAIAMDPVRHSTLVAGTDGRGVFVSEDAGKTWRPTKPRLSRQGQ